MRSSTAGALPRITRSGGAPLTVRGALPAAYRPCNRRRPLASETSTQVSPENFNPSCVGPASGAAPSAAPALCVPAPALACVAAAPEAGGAAAVSGPGFSPGVLSSHHRSEEHTSELQSPDTISYAV